MTSWVGAEQLSSALYGCQLVLIPAGVPRKPGMTRDDLFNINAGDARCLRRLLEPDNAPPSCVRTRHLLVVPSLGGSQLTQRIICSNKMPLKCFVERHHRMSSAPAIPLTAGSEVFAGIVQGLCQGVAKYCPTAWVGIISNPVNSTVPIAAEVFKRAGAVCACRPRCCRIVPYSLPLCIARLSACRRHDALLMAWV